MGLERQSSLSLTVYGMPSSLGRTHQALKVPVWEFVYMVVTAAPLSVPWATSLNQRPNLDASQSSFTPAIVVKLP